MGFQDEKARVKTEIERLQTAIVDMRTGDSFEHVLCLVREHIKRVALAREEPTDEMENVRLQGISRAYREMEGEMEKITNRRHYGNR